MSPQQGSRRLANFPIPGIASPAEINIPEPGGNSVGLLLSRCYGDNPQRRRFDTNLLVLFEAVAWFSEFRAEDDFWERLRGVLELARHNHHDCLQKVVVWYCERRKAFNHLHEQFHGKSAPSGNQAPSRIVEIIDQINSQRIVVKSRHASENALEKAWSRCVASWSAQLDAVLLQVESPFWPKTQPPLQMIYPPPQIASFTNAANMATSSAMSVASVPKTITSSSQPVSGLPVQKPPVRLGVHVVRNNFNTEKVNSKILAIKDTTSHHSSAYDESTDQVEDPQPRVTKHPSKLVEYNQEEHKKPTAFTGDHESLSSPDFSPHQPPNATAEMAQVGKPSPRKALLNMMDPECRASPSNPDIVDFPSNHIKRKKNDKNPHESAQSRKHLLCFSDISSPRKKIRSTSTESEITPDSTSLTVPTFLERCIQDGKIGLSNEKTVLDITNQPDLSNEATDAGRDNQTHILNGSNSSSEKTEFAKLKSELVTLLSNYQSKSAAIRIASQSDERLMQLECRVQRLDEIEGQMRALQDVARQIDTLELARKAQTVTTETAKPPTSLPSSGSQNLQYLISREVGSFLGGVSDEIAKLQAVIRNKIRQQEETDDGWKKMGHLADVLWILDEAFAKASNGAKALEVCGVQEL